MANSLGECLAVISASQSKFYVYVLRRPNGEPFYIGKGTGERIARHDQDARKTQQQCYRLSIIRKHLRDGGAISYELVGLYESEADAFAEECRLIAVYGRFDQGAGPLTNNTDGGEGAVNPSAATIAKRVVGLKAAMLDPEYKARAVACMHASPVRKERARASVKTPEYRAAASARFTKAWTNPEFAEKTRSASKAAQDLIWKAKHAAGIARVQADPDFRKRRLEGWLKPEAQERLRAAMARPECVSKMRTNAITQRAKQEEARQRALYLARRLGVVSQLPNHRSSLATWLRVEYDLSLFVDAGSAL